MKKIILLGMIVLLSSCNAYRITDAPYSVEWAWKVDSPHGKYKYRMTHKNTYFIYYSNTLYQVGQILFIN